MGSGRKAASAGSVVSVNVSTEKGTGKTPVERVVLTDTGVEGDAHAGRWHRQVSLLGQEAIDEFVRATGRATSPGEFAENITLRGLDLGGVAVLDRLRVGPCELEVTQIGKRCHGDSCAIFREVGQCVMPKQGVFARVRAGGQVRPGDPAEHLPRPLRVRVLTMSDRAAAGQYEDRSGPLAQQKVEEHFAPTRWHVRVERAILPDEAAALAAALTEAIGAGVDVVFVLGGTGIGPRDVSPEVVSARCEKHLPGVMEAIRVKYGRENPRAWLSRSVAGTAGTTQLYALPGSPRAVAEYLDEILKVLAHAIVMLHGIGH